jgi:DNA-binding PadR family transcriptional regulator
MPSPRGTESGVAGPRGGLREAILGLLAIRPMSGYDISRSYERALQRVWYAPVGQVYPTLKAMQAQGLLDVEVHVQESRPNRKEYRLTEQGREALLDWLSQPSALPFMHHEFISKLFLLDNLDEDKRRELVADYVARCGAWSADLEAIEQKMAPTLEGPFQKSVHFQLLSLRHLRRLVACETASARTLLEELGGPEDDGAPVSTDESGQRGLFDLWLTPAEEP